MLHAGLLKKRLSLNFTTLSGLKMSFLLFFEKNKNHLYQNHATFSIHILRSNMCICICTNISLCFISVMYINNGGSIASWYKTKASITAALLSLNLKHYYEPGQPSHPGRPTSVTLSSRLNLDPVFNWKVFNWKVFEDQFKIVAICNRLQPATECFRLRYILVIFGLIQDKHKQTSEQTNKQVNK